MPPAATKTFAAFIAQLVPQDGGSRQAAAQRSEIQKKLRARTGPISCVVSGSTAADTGIREHSGIDLLVPLQADHVQPDSAVMLRWFAEQVSAALPSLEVVVDGTAVQVPFGPGKADRHYLMPASIIERSRDGDDIYAVPDGSSGWRRTSPGSHRRYVDQQDQHAEGSARPLIRLVKAWKHLNGLPISSFYLELVAAAYVARQSPLMLSHALADLFSEFLDEQLPPCTDPSGICGTVRGVQHVFDHVIAMEAIGVAAGLIAEARAAARANDLERSMSHWKQLYNGGFPD